MARCSGRDKIRRVSSSDHSSHRDSHFVWKFRLKPKAGLSGTTSRSFEMPSIVSSTGKPIQRLKRKGTQKSSGCTGRRNALSRKRMGYGLCSCGMLLGTSRFVSLVCRMTCWSGRSSRIASMSSNPFHAWHLQIGNHAPSGRTVTILSIGTTSASFSMHVCFPPARPCDP